MVLPPPQELRALPLPKSSAMHVIVENLIAILQVQSGVTFWSFTELVEYFILLPRLFRWYYEDNATVSKRLNNLFPTAL